VKKVLIVDDIKSFIDKEKSILGRSDIRIFAASSGEEALAVHKAENVDVIIADLDMPGMNGDHLCSVIRRDEHLKHVSIIVACHGSEEEIDRIRQCKANSYITKPIRPVQFLESVGRFLDVPERKSYRVLLKVRVEGKFGSEPFYCSSRNISISGMLMDTEKALEKGDLMSCSFFLPGSECIIADAEVMRTARIDESSMSYGVKFRNLRPPFRAAIETFIETRSGKTR
jgi:CheY-like chemotaxis protein